MIILFAIVAPFTVSFKAFSTASNKLTKYRLEHAKMLIDHTTSTNQGARCRTVHQCSEHECAGI
jgi:hypothetical protein